LQIEGKNMIDSTLKNAVILIVDDQQANIDVLTGMLDANGFSNYTTTTDPRQVFRLFDELKPDLLLLDLRMPHLNGFQVMNQLKDIIPDKTYFPIIVLTADITRESKQKSIAGGASDFLSKPFDLTEVDLRINNLLKIRYLQQQLENNNQILDESGTFAENLINTIREPLIALDKDLRVVKASNSFYDFFKVNPDETIGTLIYDLGNGQWNIPKLRELLETILPEKTTFENYEVEHDFSTIGKHIMLLNARKIQRGLGKEQIILLAIEDISERKYAEDSLKKSEEEFRNLAESMPQIVWICLPDGANIYFNQQWIDYTGLTMEESHGDGWNKPFHPDDQKRAWDAWQNAIKNNKEYSLECRLRRFDGTYRWWLIRGVPQLGTDGKILKWFGTGTDIEIIKQTEERIRNSERLYRSLFENMINGFTYCQMLYDEQNKPYDLIYLSVNKAFESLTGLKEAVGKKISEVIPGIQTTNPKLIELYGRVANGGDPEQFEEYVESLKMWFFVSVYCPKQGYFVAVFDVITERKKNEEEIVMLANSLKIVNECVCITDMENKFIFVNQSFLKTYGYSEEELIGKHISIVRLPDKASASVEEILSATISVGWQGELLNKRKDGIIFPVYLSTTILNDKENKPYGLIGVATDITERKRSEEEIKEAKKQLEELYKRLNDIREDERARISREIHDELGQSLTALKMDLNWTKDLIGNNITVRGKINGMLDLVSSTIKKVQNISADLRPGILDDLGLNSAIEWYCEEFEKRYGIICHLELEDIHGINSKIQLTLFRILQEGLTNVAKHANAKNIIVKLLLSVGKIYLKISDDGIGIGEEKIKSKNSLGFIGMRERLKEFNGTLEIISSENKGTCKVVCVPLLNKESK